MSGAPRSGTQFQQILSLFEEVVPLCEELLNASDLETHVDAYESLARSMQQLSPMVDKCRQRAQEPDPDKQTYGPAIKAKILAFLERYDQLYTVYHDEILPTFDHLAQRRRCSLAEAQRRAQAEEQAARDAAVERGRQQTQQEEARRTAELAAKQRTASQKHAADEEAHRALREAQAKAASRREAIVKTAENSGQTLRAEGYRVHAHHGLRLCAARHAANLHFREALGPIYEVLVRVVENPSALYFRVIRILNEAFYDRVVQVPGSTEVLMAAGFVLKKASEVRPLIQKAKSQFEEDNGSACTTPSTYDADDLYWILEEPDPLEAFDAWTSWMQQLTWVKDWLESALSVLRRHPSKTPHQALDEQGAAL